MTLVNVELHGMLLDIVGPFDNEELAQTWCIVARSKKAHKDYVFSVTSPLSPIDYLKGVV